MSAFANLAKLIKKDFVDSGEYPVGSKLPTVHDLAARYGYSMPTVGKSIDLLMKEGWLNKSRGSGIYIESLPSPKRELRIGFIASSLDMALAHDCLRGVNYVVRKNNNILEVADSNNSVEDEYDQVNRMCNRGADGIVIYCLEGMVKGVKPDYLGSEFRDLPIVVVDLYRPEMNRPHVIFDNFSAGREMTQYLLREGRRKVAFLKFKGTHSTVDQRFLGYARALVDAGLGEYILTYDPLSDDINGDLLELFSKTFTGANAPDAIELPCDSVFEQVYPILNKMGISVPKDVILTGNDNLNQYRGGHFWPTTTPDFMRMGEMAAEMLFDCIRTGVQKDTKVILPCPLLIRQSSPKLNIVEHGERRMKGRLGLLQSSLLQ